MNIRLVVALVLFLLVCPISTWGDELCFIPSLAVKEENNSNILLATEGGMVRSDNIMTVSPGFDLTDRTARLESLLSIRLDRLFYKRNPDLDATNQYYSGSVRYAATELLNLSLDASYFKLINPSLWTGWVYNPWLPPPVFLSSGGGGGGTGGGGNTGPGASDPPSAIAIPVPQLPLIAAGVQRLASSISTDYRLTELTSFTAGYQFSQSYYERPKYHDTSHDVQAGLVVDLSTSLPRLQGRLTTDYSQYLLPNSRTINVMASLGLSYRVSEIWSISIDGGIRHTNSEISAHTYTPDGTPIDVTYDNAEWGRVGHVSLNYKDENIGVALMYIHDFTMASLAQGYQTPAERNAVSLTFQHQLTGEFSASLGASYSAYRHPVNVASDTFQQDSISVSPLVRYELSRDLALEASYELTRFDYKALDTKADREVFFIRLTGRFPYCSSCQYK